MKITLILSLLVTSLAFADGDGGAIETGNYTTVALGAAATGTTGYISYNKFSSADNMREGARRMILSNTGSPQALSQTQVRSLQGEIQEGEEIRFKYHLGLEANKNLHLQRILNSASSARSSAASYRSMAINALTQTKRVQTGTNAQGHAIYVTMPDPDYARNILYNSMASDEDAKAARYMAEHATAATRPANSFAAIKLERVFDTRDGGVNPAKNFISELTGDGGKFYQSSEIPAKVVAQASKMRLIGGLSAAGAVLGGAFMMEELTYGAASNLFKDEERDTASDQWRNLSGSRDSQSNRSAIQE